MPGGKGKLLPPESPAATDAGGGGRSGGDGLGGGGRGAAGAGPTLRMPARQGQRRTRKQRRDCPLQCENAPCWRPCPREQFSDTKKIANNSGYRYRLFHSRTKSASLDSPMYVSGWLLCCHEPKYPQVSLHQALSGPDQDDIFFQDLIHCSGR